MNLADCTGILASLAQVCSKLVANNNQGIYFNQTISNVLGFPDERPVRRHKPILRPLDADIQLIKPSVNTRKKLAQRVKAEKHYRYSVINNVHSGISKYIGPIV